MRVFISSLITGMGQLRAAARNAIESLGHEPIMAEDFGARPNSPQLACLDQLRRADVLVLVLGELYGALQPSGLSATHEEYREAKGKKPILAFTQTGISPEAKEAEFIREVQDWETGLFRASFREAVDLQKAVTRALHEWQVTTTAGALDPTNLLERALSLLPREQRRHIGERASLLVAIAGGPTQSVLRPAELEASVLKEALLRDALFGDGRIFEPAKGSSSTVVGHSLRLWQNDSPALISVDEQGSVLIALPIEWPRQEGLAVLVEEDVQQQLAAALKYACFVLDHIDSTQRLTHVAIVAKVNADGLLAWRTREEHAASPNRVSSLFPFAENQSQPVHLAPPHRPRAALRFDINRLAEDFVVLLRRQWRPSQ